jgi:hypothetical protein
MKPDNNEYFYSKKKILFEELLSELKSQDTDFGEYTLEHTRISDLASDFSTTSDLRKELEEKLKRAPDKKVCLDFTIRTYEGKYPLEKEATCYQEYVPGMKPYDYIVPESCLEVVHWAFLERSRGGDPILKNVVNTLIDVTTDWKTPDDLKQFFLDLAEGVAIADNIGELREELQTLNDDLRPSPKWSEEIQPIIWLGGPAELGWLINQLISSKYILMQGVSDEEFKKQADIILQHFQLKTSPQSLARELSLRLNSLTPDNREAFKIQRRKK